MPSESSQKSLDRTMEGTWRFAYARYCDETADHY